MNHNIIKQLIMKRAYVPLCSIYNVLHANVTNVVKAQFLEGQVASGKGRFVSLVVLCQLCRNKNLIARDTTFFFK